MSQTGTSAVLDPRAIHDPAFREAFEDRRGLVPADGFYEWQKLDAKNKQPPPSLYAVHE
jgi:putative SOS response-associated peptidase YedK